MKLRIKGNSARLRLSKTDVEKLCRESFIEESTFFGDSVFKYSLQAIGNSDILTAKFESGEMKVFIPSSFIKDWNNNDTVGFNSSPDASLQIIVEKDFKCLDETTEDQSDNFENPHTTCQE